MRNSLWEPKRRIELSYKRSLRKIFGTIEKAIKGLTDPYKIIETLKKITYSKEYEDYAKASATKMATHVYVDAGKSWKEAARKSGKGKEIHESLQEEMNSEIGLKFNEIIKSNSELIKSVPNNMAEYVSSYISKESQKGRRHEDIAKDLQEKFPDMTSSKATVIARTESSKASTALTEVRSRQVGANWYVWKTSKDGRVRGSHKHMDEVIIKWSNPPSPEKLKGEKGYGTYNAGCTFNCRCYPAPIITLSRIKFPAKVYYEERIQTMTKAEFEKLM